MSNTGFSFLQHFHIESFFLKEKCHYWYQKLELFTQISTRWYFNLFSPNFFYRLFLISVFAFFLFNIFSAVQSQFYFLLWSCSNIFSRQLHLQLQLLLVHRGSSSILLVLFGHPVFLILAFFFIITFPAVQSLLYFLLWSCSNIFSRQLHCQSVLKQSY